MPPARSLFGTSEATVRLVAEIAARYPRPHVLDVGCGNGELLLTLAPAITRGVGIDLSAAAIQAARHAARAVPHLEFRQLAAETLSAHPLGTFHVVVLMGSLEHIADPAAALQEAARRLHPGGRIVVIAISPGAPHAALTRAWLRRSRQPVIAHLGADGLRRLAARTGLEVAEIRTLYRGRRDGSWPMRAVRPVLAAYDRLGGPTRAVTLKPA